MKKLSHHHILHSRQTGFHQALHGVLTVLCLAVLALSACKHKEEKDSATLGSVYYTCSMHPQVMEEHPGNCPICGMKLIEVPKTSAITGNAVHLTPEQIRLGNIVGDTIRRGSIDARTVLSGTLNFNQSNLASVSARVDGRIEKLYFKNTGDYVHKGDKLYELYSEQLNNAKQEYLTAIQQQNTMGNTIINYAALVQGAKNKLLLWGMRSQDIESLRTAGHVPVLTTFYSTSDGYITSTDVKEGDYVMEGSTVVELAGLATLWAEAQVYTMQFAAVTDNADVQVVVPELGNVSVPGKIDFVNPEMDPATRINLVRVTLTNANGKLHPGMPVYIIVNNRPHPSITLPPEAVLTDSRGATVWIETKPGVYEPRMVETGIADEHSIEIKSGLREGDVVVITGAYLINSEYIFEHGANPMEGMEMNGMKM